MRKIMFSLMIIVLFSFIVMAEESYNNFGGEGNDYFSSDLSKFNSEIKRDNKAATIALNNPQFMPLVADLDNDSIYEIILLVNNNIVLYQANLTDEGLIEFVFLKTFSTPNAEIGDYYSNMITYDIDNDGLLEIIVHSVEAGRMYILNWNGSHINDTGFDYGTGWLSPRSNSADAMLGCGDINGCILVHNDANANIGTAGDGIRRIWGYSFNETEINTEGVSVIASKSHTPDGKAFCMPKHKSVPYGNDAYYIMYQNGASQNLVKLTINSSYHVVSTLSANAENPMSSSNCGRGLSTFTSPTLSQFSLEDDGLEIAYAYQTNTNLFRMNVIKSNLNILDRYPQSATASGWIKSNVFVSNAFIDSDKSSLCVVGFDESKEPYGQVDILCADVRSIISGVQDNTQFKYEFPEMPPFNITYDDVYTIISHSIQSIQSNKLSEILTPYGIFVVDDVTVSQTLSCNELVASCKAERIWDMTRHLDKESASISVDILGHGFEDIITLTETNLWYIDDGFVNQNAYISNCTSIKPSIDATSWQLDVPDVRIINSSRFETSRVSSSEVITGTNEVNHFTQTYFPDGSAHGYQEDARKLEFNYSIIDSCIGLTSTFFSLRVNWTSSVSNEVVDLSLWHYGSSTWDLHRTITDTNGNYEWFNFTILNITDHISNGMIKFNFNDSGEVGDGSDDYLYIDFLEVKCFGLEQTIISSQHNEVKLKVKPTDADGDIVSAKAILYYGETNVQNSGWSDNFSSTAEIPIENLYPNLTTSSSTLRICVRDSLNYIDYEVCEDYIFTVQITGDVTGDSDSCVGLTPSQFKSGECSDNNDCDDDEVCIDNRCNSIPSSCVKTSECPDGYVCVSKSCRILPTSEDNLVSSSVETFSYLSGVPILVFILIIYAVIIWQIIKIESIPTGAKVPAIVITGFCLLIAGVVLSLISWIWLLLFIFVILSLLGITFGLVMRGG